MVCVEPMIEQHTSQCPDKAFTIVSVLLFTLFQSYSAYVYFINDWAVIILLMAGLVGLPFLVKFIVFASKGRIWWKAFVWALPFLFVVWFTLSRPVEMTQPRRHSRAEIQQSCYSRLTAGELLEFYSNNIERAGFELTGIKRNQIQNRNPRDDYRIIGYRNAHDRQCRVWIFETGSDDGLREFRRVRQELTFNSALGPPIVGL
jgi:hypothetical protein